MFSKQMLSCAVHKSSNNSIKWIDILWTSHNSNWNGLEFKTCIVISSQTDHWHREIGWCQSMKSVISFFLQTIKCLYKINGNKWRMSYFGRTQVTSILCCVAFYSVDNQISLGYFHFRLISNAFIIFRYSFITIMSKVSPVYHPAHNDYRMERCNAHSQNHFFKVLVLGW